jgi:predicted AAA+ superfamily ATPase
MITIGVGMNASVLKEVVLEQNEYMVGKDTGIERECLSLIGKYVKLPHVVVISGMRRSGKSTLLAQIIRKYYSDGVYYFNFEDERLVDFHLEDFNRLYEAMMELYPGRKVFFLDEIQSVEGWELFVRRMYDRGFKFFITGSNSSLLGREAGTRLTGRHLMINLFPFSLREYLSFRNVIDVDKSLSVATGRSVLKRNFNDYLEKGGMPEYLKYGERETLERTYDDIIYRDIVARHDIKEVKILRELALYLLSNCSSLFTFNKLKQMLGLGSANTAKSYVGYLEDSFLAYTSSLFDYSLKRQILTPKKIYGVDNGILNLVSFRFSENYGRLLENLVFIELKRRGREIYYYKTKKNLEVDLLVREKNEVSGLIQVCASLLHPDTEKREIRALAASMGELKLKKGLILTGDEEKEIKVDSGSIKVKPVYKWLLERD